MLEYKYCFYMHPSLAYNYASDFDYCYSNLPDLGFCNKCAYWFASANY